MAQCQIDPLGFVAVGEVPLELRGEDVEVYVPVGDWEAGGDACGEWEDGGGERWGRHGCCGWFGGWGLGGIVVGKWEVKRMGWSSGVGEIFLVRW